MRVRVIAFAGLRELVGPSRELELDAGATAGDAWRSLVREIASLGALEKSTRLSRGGTLIAATDPLREGDEIALLPPFGGG